MSFDKFVQGFHNGKSANFPFAWIERGFERFARHKDAKCWGLCYPDGGCCEVYLDTTKAEVSGFTVSGPPASPEFWQTLFDLLESAPTCLFWPGGAPAVASALMRDHMPPDMIEKLGEPTIVAAPAMIIKAIRNS